MLRTKYKDLCFPGQSTKKHKFLLHSKREIWRPGRTRSTEVRTGATVKGRVVAVEGTFDPDVRPRADVEGAVRRLPDTDPGA